MPATARNAAGSMIPTEEIGPERGNCRGMYRNRIEEVDRRKERPILRLQIPVTSYPDLKLGLHLHLMQWKVGLTQLTLNGL
jgi:hypothetical protein